MSKPPRDRFWHSSNTYFITASADGNRALFQSKPVALLFLETLFGYRQQQKYHVHEFVVMPSHIHLLISPEADITIERALQLIKGGFSYRVKKELGISSQIWQRGYVDHRVRDASDYSQHRAYILANPVRANLAETPEVFPFSSAFPGFKLDPVPQWLKPL